MAEERKPPAAASLVEDYRAGRARTAERLAEEAGRVPFLATPEGRRAVLEANAQEGRAPDGNGTAADGLAACTRVYSAHGKTAHLLPLGDSPNSGYPFTLCRRQPRLFTSWLGTGSQGEYERAAQLPLCSWCEHRVLCGPCAARAGEAEKRRKENG